MGHNRLHETVLFARQTLESYISLRPEEFGHPDRHRLECCCGIAAWFVCRTLWRIRGVPSLLVFGSYKKNDHCWTELADGTYIDITATQFEKRYSAVEIIEAETARAYGFRANLTGVDAYEHICGWDPGPLLNGPALARFADRRTNPKVLAVRGRPRHYGAGFGRVPREGHRARE